MKKKIFILIIIIIIVGSLGFLGFKILNKPNNEPKITKIDTINNYKYELKSNSTDLYKNEFNNLKTILNNSELNDQEYAISIAKLFIIDLYTLDNKLNKYDVGGVDFVYPDYVSNYKLNVQDTLYKYMEDNSQEKRQQKLPIVSSIELVSVEETTYIIKDETYSGYKIMLKWEYIENLEYDTEGEIIAIKKDNYYYIVEKN